MRVGIQGSGLMGSKLGMLFARAGHQLAFDLAGAGREPPQQEGAVLLVAQGDGPAGPPQVVHHLPAEGADKPTVPLTAGPAAAPQVWNRPSQAAGPPGDRLSPRPSGHSEV